MFAPGFDVTLSSAFKDRFQDEPSFVRAHAPVPTLSSSLPSKLTFSGSMPLALNAFSLVIATGFDTNFTSSFSLTLPFCSIIKVTCFKPFAWNLWPAILKKLFSAVKIMDIGLENLTDSK